MPQWAVYFFGTVRVDQKVLPSNQGLLMHCGRYRQGAHVVSPSPSPCWIVRANMAGSLCYSASSKCRAASRSPTHLCIMYHTSSSQESCLALLSRAGFGPWCPCWHYTICRTQHVLSNCYSTAAVQRPSLAFYTAQHNSPCEHTHTHMRGLALFKLLAAGCPGSWEQAGDGSPHHPRPLLLCQQLLAGRSIIVIQQLPGLGVPVCRGCSTHYK